MATKGDETPDLANNLVIRIARKFLPITPTYHGQKFTIREAGRIYATPLLLVLLLVEASDLVFAVDSIPAIFAVTSDPFIVFTSNICAILGLRSLFFLLASVLGRFHLLKPALAAVLAFVGGKMLLLEVVKIPIGASLGVVAGLIGLGVVGSLLFPRKLAADVR
jgi:tellurite resistance protein TerC